MGFPEIIRITILGCPHSMLHCLHRQKLYIGTQQNEKGGENTILLAAGNWQVAINIQRRTGGHRQRMLRFGAYGKCYCAHCVLITISGAIKHKKNSGVWKLQSWQCDAELSEVTKSGMSSDGCLSCHYITDDTMICFCSIKSITVLSELVYLLWLAT